MRRCDSCRRRRELVPWRTTSGLVIGQLCAACLASKEQFQQATARALEEPPAVRAKPTAPFYQRRHPGDHRIAEALLEDPAVLNLRTRRLQADVQARFGVSPCVARNAVAIARRQSAVVP